MSAATGTAPEIMCKASLGGEDNVDPREVAYYERLALTWWDRSGPFWPLHRLNELRTQYLRSALARAFGRDPRDGRPLAGLRILDVGCGGGILSEAMARLGARVRGIDVVRKNVEVARLHARGAGLTIGYDVTTAAALRERGDTYDVVLNMEVVEHVPDVPTFMEDCIRLVRPGGAMAVATINRTFLSWLFAIVGAEYVLRWLPRGTHRWRQFVTPGELVGLLEAETFAVTEQTGVRVNPFNRHFALTELMAVNYMLVARNRNREAGITDTRWSGPGTLPPASARAST